MQKLKVAIIGAGPSGFGVAEVLRKKEYADVFDVTIYESNDYVGGKCRTVFEDGTIANGVPGGYEAGAGFIPKYARSYADLMRAIKKYDIKLRSIEQPNRETFHYLDKGKTVSIGQLQFSQIFTKPHIFFNVINSYLAYAADYIRYGGKGRAGFDDLPDALTKPLSPDENPAIFSRYAHVVQGFGYADMDDPYLRPSLPYYYRYLEVSMKPPLSMVESGTQSIWSTIAEQYPAGSIKLNTQVTKVTRAKDKVIVETRQGSDEHDYLVVATPIKPALKYLDIDAGQKQFMEKMKYNHFITVLCKVSGINAVGTFNLTACSDKTQLGHVLFCYKENAESDTVTLNVFVDPHKPSDDKTILDTIEKSLGDDLGATLLNREQAQIFHWDDYFGHLGAEDLKNGWYDKFDAEIQGKGRTLFVSSGLHMETVGASFQYGTQLAQKYAKQWRDDNQLS